MSELQGDGNLLLDEPRDAVVLLDFQRHRRRRQRLLGICFHRRRFEKALIKPERRAVLRLLAMARARAPRQASRRGGKPPMFFQLELEAGRRGAISECAVLQARWPRLPSCYPLSAT